MPYSLSLLSYSTDEVDGEPGADSGDESLTRMRPALAELGEIEEEGPEGFELRCGSTRVSLRFTKSVEGRLREIEVAFPFGAVDDEIGDTLRGIFEAADRQRVRVFDPQMGRTVSKGDVPAILARFSEASSYHSQYSGVCEDSRQGLSSAATHKPPPLVSAKFKAMAGVVLILVVLYLIFRMVVIDSVLDALSPNDRLELDPPPGPPPGWLDRHRPSGG